MSGGELWVSPGQPSPHLALARGLALSSSSPSSGRFLFSPPMYAIAVLAIVAIPRHIDLIAPHAAPCRLYVYVYSGTVSGE